MLKDFDIFKEAGGPARALDKTFVVRPEAGEGIRITAYPSGRQIFWGAFPGTTAMIDQMPDQGIVNVALFNVTDEIGDIGRLLAADSLIGASWPRT